MSKHQLFILILALFIAPYGFTSDSNKSTPSVSVAFTFSMPPYLSEDKASGIERDIIYNSFIAAGYEKIEIHNVHYVRAIELAKLNEIDAIVSNQSNSSYAKEIDNIVSSNKTIDYVDCAISLKSRNLKLDKINDYYDKRIWAFKSASEVLGVEFNKMTKANEHYSENFDQRKQLDMLAMERIDVAISDRNIFSEKLKSSIKYKNVEFNFHNIGPVTPRVIRSTNKELIERFNKGLNELKRSGQYQEIIDESYSSSCNS